MIDLNRESDLHRLASGDVSIDEENDAIVQCETNPTLYRNVALAFIEERQFREALTEFAKTSPPPNVPRWRAWTEAANPMILAACLLLVVASSVLAYRSGQRSNANGSFAGADDPKDKPIVVQLVYPEPKHADDRRDIQQLDALSRPLFSKQARELLRDAGFRIEEEFKLHVVKDPLGEQRAFPDRRVRLQYVNQ